MCKVGSPCVSTAGFCVRRCSLRIHCSLQWKTLSQHGELYWQDTRSQGSKYKSSALMAWIRAQPRHKAKALNDVASSAKALRSRTQSPALHTPRTSASSTALGVQRIRCMRLHFQGISQGGPRPCHRPVASTSSRCDGSTTAANISQSSQS